MPERPKRPAESRLEQHQRDTMEVHAQEPPSQQVLDLLLLALDVPRSGRADIEGIVIPSRSSSSSIAPVTAQPVQGSEVQSWHSQVKAEFLPSTGSRIINALSVNRLVISADGV